MLQDLGGGLGVTDPVSGSAVVKARRGHTGEKARGESQGEAREEGSCCATEGEAGEKTRGDRPQARLSANRPPRASPRVLARESRRLAQPHHDLPAAVSGFHAAQGGRHFVEGDRSLDVRAHRAAPDELPKPVPHRRAATQSERYRALA